MRQCFAKIMISKDEDGTVTVDIKTNATEAEVKSWMLHVLQNFHLAELVK